MGIHAKDLTGQIFGRLTVLKRVGKKGNNPLWECRCICGKVRQIIAYSLTSGASQSCGCLRAERLGAATNKRNFKHGKSESKIHNAWEDMKNRCTNLKCRSYKDYGARGIKVCQRWNDSFDAFYADTGDPPEGLSLERIDNEKGYGPDNCRWATQKEQCNNTRRNVFLTYQGKTQTLSQWAEEYGIDRRLFWRKLKICKWPIEKIIDAYR
jgi:hypothetical protein